MNLSNEHDALSAFESAVLGEIRAIAAEKEAAGTIPAHALAVEIRERLNNALNRLYTLRLIEVGSTLNDKWIKPVEADAENK